jgi:hypothetical protein
MSRDCTQAVWDMNLKPATLKLTLLSLADRADNDGHRCYPSIERISKDTALNKKTVQSNITKLIDFGLVQDTGKRVGQSQRVRVLKIIIKQIQKWDDPENGMIDDPENGMIDDPENGMHNQSLNQSVNQSDNNDRSNDQSVMVEKAFEWFWSTSWKPVKKAIGKVDTSPKAFNLEKRWKPLFNKKYFSFHTTEKFKDEVNAMAAFCKEAHNADRGRFENMQLARFLTEAQWRDE